MQPQRAPNRHASRESWLRAAADELRPVFAQSGLAVPAAMRFSIAFTSYGKASSGGKMAAGGWSKGSLGRWPGECWPGAATDDRHCEIILRADLADPAEVLGVLMHELIHAALPLAKHGREFRDAALRLGLEGRMRYALPGPVLRERLAGLAAGLGPLPHARLNFDRVTLAGLAVADRPKKQTTRMLKADCRAAGCGYTVRVAARWITACGPPHCPLHGAMRAAVPAPGIAPSTAGPDAVSNSLQDSGLDTGEAKPIPVAEPGLGHVVEPADRRP